MTLDMLRYFVALTEKRSFTEAAEACFISQSALSRAINHLEKDLNCPLLFRENRKTIRLTEAGQVFYIEAKRVLSQMRVLEERVHRAAEEALLTVTLGYIAYGMLNAFRQNEGEKMRSLREHRLTVETVYATASEITERLLSGELDCIIMPEAAIKGLRHLRRYVFHEAQPRIMLPKSHPLFSRESIALRELSDSQFVFYDTKELPSVFVQQVQNCRENGFEPRIAAYGHKLGDIETLIQQHNAVSITTDVFDYANSEFIHIRPLSGLPSSLYVLAMLDSVQNPAAESFFQIITSTEETHIHANKSSKYKKRGISDQFGIEETILKTI